MTEQTPATEAGRAFYDDHLHYDDLPPDRMTYVRERILAIEAEARAPEYRAGYRDGQMMALREAAERSAYMDVDWWERALSARNGSDRLMAEYVVNEIAAILDPETEP